MKKYTVHMLVNTGLRYIAACGLWAYNHGVVGRRGVSCKRCLKTKAARSPMRGQPKSKTPKR